MSPIEKIKEGILQQSWMMVIDGYQDMTGDKSLSDILEEPVEEEVEESEETEETVNILDSLEELEDEKFVEPLLAKIPPPSPPGKIITKNRKVVFISSPEEIKEKKENEKLAKKTSADKKLSQQSHPKYVSDIFTCSGCSTKIDLAKTPRVEKGVIRCQKCNMVHQI